MKWKSRFHSSCFLSGNPRLLWAFPSKLNYLCCCLSKPCSHANEAKLIRAFHVLLGKKRPCLLILINPFHQVFSFVLFFRWNSKISFEKREKFWRKINKIKTLTFHFYLIFPSQFFFLMCAHFTLLMLIISIEVKLEMEFVICALVYEFQANTH